jgi:hypothetical protein
MEPPPGGGIVLMERPPGRLRVCLNRIQDKIGTN